MEFIIAAANLHVFNYGLTGETNREYVKKENETVPQASTDENELQEIVSSLPSSSSLAGYRLNPVEFEKDDDTNFHFEFIIFEDDFEE
ncbi:hypothetical protein C2G38_2229732 [Gigaspora rosea]|uniref:Ubiquitin-activating enzyme SCCH domain-containing protein n=1 Tax=Gigaspora rosea TaxID=44941 RepID=A0A397TZ78_9GLOM|nr:hypothetical protein C2G38_2229732 [Gigaspora rosea]